MAEGQNTGIAEQIAKRKREIEFLEALQVAEDDGDLRKLALETLGGKVASPAKTRKRSEKPVRQNTVLGRIIEHLKAQGNSPASILELAEALQCSESGIRQVLYTKHKELFVREQDAEGRRMLFHLVNA